MKGFTVLILCYDLRYFLSFCLIGVLDYLPEIEV